MKTPANYYMNLSQTLLHLAEQREMAWEQAMGNYKLTLQLLQDIKSGNVDIQQVVVTDDGWKLMPPEPEEESHGDNGFVYAGGGIASTST